MTRRELAKFTDWWESVLAKKKIPDSLLADDLIKDLRSVCDAAFSIGYLEGRKYATLNLTMWASGEHEYLNTLPWRGSKLAEWSVDFPMDPEQSEGTF